MTVINAADRFAARSHDGIWVSLRSGGSGQLAECKSQTIIRAILAEAALKHPETRRVLALEWDDKSCFELEVLYECDPADEREFRDHVEVDDGYYEVSFTGMARGCAA